MRNQNAFDCHNYINRKYCLKPKPDLVEVSVASVLSQTGVARVMALDKAKTVMFPP